MARYRYGVHLATLLLPSIALMVGGVSLVAGAGGGLYWILASILLAFVSASINAWVLLVEIKRQGTPTAPGCSDEA